MGKRRDLTKKPTLLFSVFHAFLFSEKPTLLFSVYKRQRLMPLKMLRLFMIFITGMKLTGKK
jgi:hypothetical protein